MIVRCGPCDVSFNDAVDPVCFACGGRPTSTSDGYDLKSPQVCIWGNISPALADRYGPLLDLSEPHP